MSQDNGLKYLFYTKYMKIVYFHYKEFEQDKHV